MLCLPRPDAAPLTCRLEGPPGEPQMLPMGFKGAPSRDAAALLTKQTVDTIKLMQDTAWTELEDYRVTEVSGAFWAEWYAQNKDFDVVTQRMVFPLEGW